MNIRKNFKSKTVKPILSSNNKANNISLLNNQRQLYSDFNKFYMLINNDMTLSTTNPIRIINTNEDIAIYKNINENINYDKTVVSIYGNKYGFGDYIRGSIVIAHYAKYFGIYFKMSMNTHAINKYLNEEEPMQHYSTENIEDYNIYGTKPITSQYYKLYLQFIQFIKSPEKVLYIETNMFYNLKFPSQDIKNLINSRISFKQEYHDMAEKMIDLHNYTVLHIRFDDDYFNLDPDNSKIFNLYNEITKLNLPTNTFVMSNNYIIKTKINEEFGFHFIDKIPVHSAVVTELNSNDFDTTIIEYIILSKSIRTYCFTRYSHGSGFSEQCSVLNNIPYQVQLIDI